jgi:hypothetical protein
MNYTNVKNPKWNSSEKTSIDCIVNFENIGEIIFTASLNDQHDHTTEIYNRCVAGEFGTIAEPIETNNDEKGEVLILSIEEIKKLNYKEFRKAEYPPAEVYLDAVVKGDQAAINKYIADCKAVKAKY